MPNLHFGIAVIAACSLYYYNVIYDRDLETEKIQVPRASHSPGDAFMNTTRIRFFAFKRHFSLLLRPIAPETSPFADDLVVNLDGLVQDVQLHRFVVEGYDEVDGPESHVYGSILDGAFDGHIDLSDGDRYTVHRAAKLISNSDNRPYHSIFVHDTKANYRHMLRKEVTVDTYQSFGGDSLFGSKYSDQFERNSVNERDSSLRYKGRRCSMHLQADHKLFEDVFRKEGKGNTKRTLEEIVSFVYTHIRGVNKIYQNTDFKGILGIHMAVKQISVFSPETCTPRNEKARNPFCKEDMGSFEYHDVISAQDQSMFCLSYMMTFRPFYNTEFGVAHIKGLCRSFDYHDDTLNMWSPNIGLVTTFAEGQRVSNRQTQLIFAHEIGHSLGANHDEDSLLPEGEYIMHPKDGSHGLHPNNYKLSEQSIAEISRVMDTLLRQKPYDPALEAGLPGNVGNCLQ